MSDSATHWFALKTHREFEVERQLSQSCQEVFLPVETVVNALGQRRLRPVIPHLLFFRTDSATALALEKRSRDISDPMPLFWIYRYNKDATIQPVSQDNIDLIRLLTATDTSRCEVYNKTDFTRGQHVRVTAGKFAGYCGYVQRIKKNRHVIVKIEGICAIALPFIHPDLLQPISSADQ